MDFDDLIDWLDDDDRIGYLSDTDLGRMFRDYEEEDCDKD